MTVSPSAASAATHSAAPPRRSVHRTAAPWSRSTPPAPPPCGRRCDIRPHAGQLIHMAVATAEQVLLKHRRPPAHRSSAAIRTACASVGKPDRGAVRTGPGAQTSAARQAIPALSRKSGSPPLECRRHGGQVFPRPRRKNRPRRTPPRREIGSPPQCGPGSRYMYCREGLPPWITTVDAYRRRQPPRRRYSGNLKIFNLRLTGRWKVP